jgi:3-oxoacyl-(acyl-carrier-protein) synthase
MMNQKIYITSIRQISVQQPLTDGWFDTPTLHHGDYVRAIDPDFKQYLTPNTARRLGIILKRALVVSQKAMEEAGVSNPDAIITGTGLGCIENTEIFLRKLVFEGEELLNPTQFMQSTHNTISSLIAIESKCNGYNSTYSHNAISLECALQDAFLQLTTGKIQNALVGAHDEITPVYYTLLKKAGYWGNPGQTFAGETAVAMMLSNRKTENSLCEIEAVEKAYGRNAATELAASLPDGIDCIMTGANGNAENDSIYFENCAKLFPDIPLLQYKNIFGEGYTASAFGLYAAALCLNKGKIPEFLCLNSMALNKSQARKILCYNQFENKNHTFVLLSKR